RFYIANRGKQRGQLSLFVVWIDNNGDRQVADFLSHFVGVVSEYRNGLTDTGRSKRSNNLSNKSHPVDGKQRLGPTHAAGLTSGKYNSDDHDDVNWSTGVVELWTAPLIPNAPILQHSIWPIPPIYTPCR